MRRTIALVAVLVLAAIGLFLLLRGEGGGESEAERAARVTREAELAAARGAAGSGAALPPSRVRLEGSGTGTGTGTGTGVKTYVTDTGNLVRDHRTDVHETIAVPAPLPPEERTLASTVTAEIGRKLQPLVRGCGADVPTDARGAAPVVHVTLTVDIAGEVLTSSAATAVTSDVTGDSAEKVVDCVRDRAAGLTVPAKGEPDRTDYIVQYPVRLR